MVSAADVHTAVTAAAREAGFDLAGIAPISAFPELQYFRTWIAEGRGGEMHYLEAREPGGELKRVVVGRVFPWAHSVIVAAVNYHSGQPYSTGPGSNARPVAQNEPGPDPSVPACDPGPRAPRHRGWISRYAWPQRDYHDEVMDRLHRLERRFREATGDAIQTRCYVDTGPLLERIYARYAGVGWLGKNTCLIHERLGSWLFLGLILTAWEMKLTAEFPSPVPAPDRCGTCTRCLDACPTQAFLGPRQLDASRCISYLTIEKRGPIPEELRTGVGRHVFGCDICQEVCPWNRKAPASASSGLQPRPELVNPDLEWLASIGDQEFQDSFRGSPIRRAKRSGLRRNAIVAMGNSGDGRFLPILERLAGDDDPVVASHAEWALSELRS
jgi:epoxyqueuosine reductase